MQAVWKLPALPAVMPHRHCTSSPHPTTVGRRCPSEIAGSRRQRSHATASRPATAIRCCGTGATRLVVAFHTRTTHAQRFTRHCSGLRPRPVPACSARGLSAEIPAPHVTEMHHWAGRRYRARRRKKPPPGTGGGDGPDCRTGQS